MQKVLVTGAAGFVGRRLVRRLLEDGFEVHAVDSLRPLTGAIAPASGWPLYEPRDFPAFKFYQRDCRDWFAERGDTDFDYVFHLAAMVGGRLMIEERPLAVADDLAIDAGFWQWAARCRPRQSVSFSSSAAYPIELQRQQGYVLLREDMIDFQAQLGMPDMSYGWAKLTSEYLGRLAYERHDVRSICFRPFSGYGEDQDMAYPFPSICKRVLDNRGAREIEIWGSGLQMRDFIHIDDCVEGIMRMKDSFFDGAAVNLSTGEYTRFIDLAAEAADIVGFRPELRPLADKPEGVFARGGDTARQKALGFNARISLKEGLTRVLNYLGNNS